MIYYYNMQFCPKCDNILDISKTAVKSNIQSLDETTPTMLSSTASTASTPSASKITETEDILDLNKQVENLITKIQNSDNISNDDIKNITHDIFTNNKSYKDLSKHDKTTVLKSFTVLLTKLSNNELSNTHVIYNICNNCFYNEPIKTKTLIINRTNINASSIINADMDRFSNMRYDKTLPHTRQYVCKNKECTSHNNYTKRDAVWFRPYNNNYITYYVCVTCGTFWNTS